MNKYLSKMKLVLVILAIIATISFLLFNVNKTLFSYHQMKNVERISLLKETKNKIIGRLEIPHGYVNFSLQVSDNQNNEITQYEYQGTPQVRIVINKDTVNNEEFKKLFTAEFKHLEKDLFKIQNNQHVVDRVQEFKKNIHLS